MEAQIKTMVKQQLECHTQRMVEMEGQMLEKLAELTKERNPEVNEEISSNMDRTSFRFLPKLEFPSFDGSNPRNWVKKCSRYFVLCKIPNSQRGDVALIHLIGKVKTWFASYIAVRRNVDWSDFIVDVCNRLERSWVVELWRIFINYIKWDLWSTIWRNLRNLSPYSYKICLCYPMIILCQASLGVSSLT